jgi:hypothetical protein
LWTVLYWNFADVVRTREPLINSAQFLLA